MNAVCLFAKFTNDRIVDFDESTTMRDGPLLATLTVGEAWCLSLAEIDSLIKHRHLKLMAARFQQMLAADKAEGLLEIPSQFESLDNEIGNLTHKSEI